MKQPREFLDRNTYVDDEGDVLPFADIEPSLDRPPVVNASIVQGMDNLQKLHEYDAEIDAAEAEAKWQALQDTDAGPHVTMEQYYQDQLDLLDFVSGSLMRRGFEKGGSRTQEAVERYGFNLPNVEAGARRNHQKAVHIDMPRIYHADELIKAGFEPEEVMFDAKTTMRSEAQHRYGGPENKNKRAARRRELKRKLGELKSE